MDEGSAYTRGGRPRGEFIRFLPLRSRLEVHWWFNRILWVGRSIAVLVSRVCGWVPSQSANHVGQGAYWLTRLVPLAFGLDDQRIQDQVKYYLDYLLDHQQADGWLGWETTQAKRGLWARTLLLNGLIVSQCVFYPFEAPRSTSEGDP